MTSADILFYEFGLYSIDVFERVLTRDGVVVPLTPKAFETLLVLVRNSGHIVSKNDLMKEVWPDSFVEEANLTQNIFALRRILGESNAQRSYIETVPRRGYRFVAPVQTIVAASEASGEIQHAPAGGRADQTIAIIAVLPFVNQSADPKIDNLADGITESVINNLSQLSRLRVMSRSTVFQYRDKEIDAQRIGRELHVDAVLVGRVNSLESRLVVSTELIDVVNGWQLWGEHFERVFTALLEVQEEIAKHISTNLRQRLNGDEERRLTKRYTENSDAYQAYLQGRYCWSKYTKEALEQAVGYFRQAINLDPTYALAYAGAIDCYLRLATNYLRPAEDCLEFVPASPDVTSPEVSEPEEARQRMVRIREEWDRKAIERESKRAAELKSHYPTAHQWYAAYRYSMRLYLATQVEMKSGQSSAGIAETNSTFELEIRNRIQYSEPMPSEQVQVFCIIAREQTDVGNYEAACAILQRWWSLGEWPKLEGLGRHSAADLLLTTGVMTGLVASARQIPRGQKHAEALINGAIGIFEQLASKSLCAEGRIELSSCHYREGSFDLARITLLSALDTLSNEDRDLRSVALIRLVTVDRHAGRLEDAVARLEEVGKISKLAGPWATGRYHVESAIALKNLGIAEMRPEYIDRALDHYRQGLYELEAIGGHRMSASGENNLGYLLLTLERFEEAEMHLLRARRLFDAFADKARRAQVDETLAQLHLAANRLELSEQAALRSIETLMTGGEDALLAEALTTHARVLCKLGRHREAKRILDRACGVAERCGDNEGAGKALLIITEEMENQLDDYEREELKVRLPQLLANSQQASLRRRLGNAMTSLERTISDN